MSSVQREKRDVFGLEMMRKIDECDMEEFGALDSAKAIAIMGAW